MSRRVAWQVPEYSHGRRVRLLDHEAARRRLSDASDALGLDLTFEQIDALLRHVALLRRWGRVFNLTALHDENQVLTHHFIDCLAAVPSLRRFALDRPLSVLDVGSGAGLPGAVLAVVQPQWKVDCVDAAAKKASFVRQVAAELGLGNLRSWHGRVETMSTGWGGTAADQGGRWMKVGGRFWQSGSRFDLVISRAFGSLADFVAQSRAVLADDGAWVAMKGRPSATELAALPAEVDMFHVEQLRVPGLDANRCLVWLRPRQSTSGG